jgi:hypothetical protein
MSFWANVFLPNVFLGKCHSGQTSSGQTSSGQMSFWSNVFLGKRLLGKRLMGKCLSGQMSSGQMSFWANVSGQMLYGQMSGHHLKAKKRIFYCRGWSGIHIISVGPCSSEEVKVYSIYRLYRRRRSSLFLSFFLSFPLSFSISGFDSLIFDRTTAAHLSNERV